MKLLTLAAALLAFAAPAPAASPGEFAAFDAFLDQFRQERSIPALSAAIVRDGEIVWQRVYGFADDEGDVPATPDTTFFIASVTKPIAAAAILREAAEGRLSLDTPLAADPDWAETCEWLAGTDIPFGGGGSEADGRTIPPVSCGRALTVADALHMRVNGPAGSGFVYNPIVYARLDRVIEGAGGRPLREMVRANVIGPAGMDDIALGWRDPQAGAALRRLAQPFVVDEEGRRKAALPDDDFRAAAGIYASARQLARFDIAFDSGRILPPALRDEVVNAWRTRPGYAFGWFNQQWDGHRLLWHSGWEPGAYSALYLKVPDQRLTLIVLANTEGVWWGNSLVAAEVERSPIARRFLETFVD